MESIVQRIKGLIHKYFQRINHDKKGIISEKNAIKKACLKYFLILKKQISKPQRNIKYKSQNSLKNPIISLSRGTILINDFHKIIQNMISMIITGTLINLAIKGIKVMKRNTINRLNNKFSI